MSEPVYQWQPTTRQIASQSGLDPARIVRFDHNTSPTAPSWVGEIAAHQALSLNEYPGADYRPLREAIGGYTGTRPDQVVPGAGADELILLTAGAFLPPGATALSAPPTYALYKVATAQRQAQLIEVPRSTADFALDLDAMLEEARRSDLVWLCVPNNPTGHRDPDEQIRAVIENTQGIVVLDAAYAEFTGDRWAPWIDRYLNLIVLGTLSKAFALAGARVGYSLSSPNLADALHRRRPPGSVSSVSAALAERALAEPEWAADNVRWVADRRAELVESLEAIGWRTHPSLVNFVLTEVGPQASSLAEDLMWNDGLVVRSFPTGHPLCNYLRITVRSANEHDRLLSSLTRRLT